MVSCLPRAVWERPVQALVKASYRTPTGEKPGTVTVS